MKQVFALFLLFTSYASFSQIEFGPRISLGTVFTDIETTSDRVESGDASYGFGIGAFARIGTQKIKLMPELLYTSTSSNINFIDDNSIEQISETKLNKIDLPITIQIMMGNLISLQGGVTGSYILDAEDTYKDKLNKTFNNYEDITYGYNAGIGLDIGSLIIDLRYEGPLSEVSSSNEDSPIKFDQRQQMVKASIGFNIF